MNIIKLTRTDIGLLKKAIVLFNTVFEKDAHTPGEAYLTTILQQTNFHIFVTVHNQQVVAACTGYELPLCTRESTELFIYDLAVATQHQRTGIGTALIEEIKKFAQARNQVLFVSAHTEDVHATNFYKRIFGGGEEVQNFEFVPRPT